MQAVAMVDSGNTAFSSCNNDVFEALGFTDDDLEPVSGEWSIGTAKADSRLTIRGRTRRMVNIHLTPKAPPIKVRLVVLPDLDMPINLSGADLARHQVKMTFGSHIVYYGVRIPLSRRVDHEKEVEPFGARLYTAAAVTVQPRERVHVKAVTPDAFIIGKDAIISSVATFSDQFDLHPWHNAAVHVTQSGKNSSQGICKVGMMNTTMSAITVPAGTFYGELDVIKEHQRKESNYDPFRISAMGPVNPRQQQVNPRGPLVENLGKPELSLGLSRKDCGLGNRERDSLRTGGQKTEVPRQGRADFRNDNTTPDRECDQLPHKTRDSTNVPPTKYDNHDDPGASLSQTDGSRVTKFRQEKFNLPPPPDKQSDPMTGDNVKVEDWMKGETTANNVDRRYAHFCNIFDLKSNKNIKTADEMNQFVGLLLKHWNLFSWDGQYGKTTLIQHYIKTTPGIRPVHDRYRPNNKLLDKSVKEQLLKWIEHDVIEPSDSPWNSNLLAVVKASGGTDVRWTVDYRKLNAVTEIDRFPIGNIEDNLSRLGESSLYSALDNAGAFHVIEIAKEDRHKTSFSSPFNCWQFTRMPFGLSGGPSSYARLVVQVLRGIPPEVAVAYVDDVLIHSNTFNKHLENLDRVMTAYSKAGLKLNPAKCTLLASKVNYLGHTVSKEGFLPQENYVNVVNKWPIPRTRQQVQILLGKAGYYRKFIPHYAKIVKPLTDVLKITDCAPELLGDRSPRPSKHKQQGDNEKGKPSKKVPLKLSKFERKKIMEVPITPTPEMIKAVNEIKKRLVEAPILAHPRFNDLEKEPFILDTDWCKDTNTVSGCLSQRQIIDGKPVEKVIGYAAKKLGKSQANYSAQKGELSAVIYMTDHFHYQLRFGKFIIRTDNTATKALKTTHDPTGMISRWRQRMAQFDFDIYHRSGEKHGNADALSRVDFLKHDPDDDIDPFDEKMDRQTVFSMNPFYNQRIGGLGDDREAWTPSVTKALQDEDHDLSRLKQWVKEGKKPPTIIRAEASQDLKAYLNLFESLLVDGDDVLRYSKPEYHQDGSTLNTRDVIILPRASLVEAVTRIHQLIGHLGHHKTLQSAMRNVYGHRMREVSEAVCQTCLTCQAKGGKPGKSNFALNPPRQGYAFQSINCDIVGPMVKSRQQHEYLLTVECMFTRWVEAFPLRRPTGLEVATKLAKEVFPRFGYPDIIKVDNGTHFKNQTIKELTEATGIKVIFSPPYHPSSNPVERQHRTLKSMLTAMLTELSYRKPSMWEDFLPAALFSMRTMINQSTGYTPFQLMFGRQASTDLDLIFGTPPQPEEYEDYDSFAKAHTHHIQSAYRWANNNISTAIKRTRRFYYNNPERAFKVGAKVWLLTPIIKPGQRKTFLRPYTGPWTVTRKVNEVTYEISPHPLWSRKANAVVSIDRLKAYVAPDGEDEDPRKTHPPGMNDDLSFPGDDHLEDIQCEPEEDTSIDDNDIPEEGPLEVVREEPDIAPLPVIEEVNARPPAVPRQQPDNIPRPQQRHQDEPAPDRPVEQEEVPEQPPAPLIQQEDRQENPRPALRQPILPQPADAVRPKAKNPRLPSEPTRERHPRQAKDRNKYGAPRGNAASLMPAPRPELTDQSAVLKKRRLQAESQGLPHTRYNDHSRQHQAYRQLLDDRAEHMFRQAYRAPASSRGPRAPSAAQSGQRLLRQRRRR